MGMFDIIKINIEKLPISNEDKKRLTKEEFQTKSLDKTLTNYRITDEGLLEEDSVIRWGNDEADYNSPPNFERRNDIHGYISFYTSVDDEKGHEWFEFVAKFTDGKLVSLQRLKDGEGRWHGNRAAKF